jgi:hypothetical protein
MKTLGWLLHSAMRGLGQKVTPGALQVLAAGQFDHGLGVGHRLAWGAHTLRQPLGVLRVAAVDDVEEGRLDLLGDGPAAAAPSSMRSSSRIGVTSAAVPVKKASSLM